MQQRLTGQTQSSQQEQLPETNVSLHWLWVVWFLDLAISTLVNLKGGEGKISIRHLHLA